jgi:hypothetical protein
MVRDMKRRLGAFIGTDVCEFGMEIRGIEEGEESAARACPQARF